MDRAFYDNNIASGRPMMMVSSIASGRPMMMVVVMVMMIMIGFLGGGWVGAVMSK
jgi:hypothetical protein